MALKEDLAAEVAKIFRLQWTEREGRIVPAAENLSLGNERTKLEATVLYADMAESTVLVDTKTAAFAAEVYKSYLTCAAKIVKAEGGAITAYDGDRIMAVFLGDYKNSSAARAGLKINGAVQSIVNPALKSQYTTSTYKVRHRVGVDTSSLHVSRVGVRNDNDLVWVGRAANYAAKLCAIQENDTVFITDEVFAKLSDELKMNGSPRQAVWKERQWSQMANKRIYSSNWTWVI
jgi:class 3 adenylate cyclase